MDRQFLCKINEYIRVNNGDININFKIYPDYKRYKLYNQVPLDYTDTNTQFSDTPLSLVRILSVKTLSEKQKKAISYYHSIGKLDYKTFAILLEEDNLSEDERPVWFYDATEAIELNSAIIKVGLKDTPIGILFNRYKDMKYLKNFLETKEANFIPFFNTAIEKMSYDLRYLYKEMSSKEQSILSMWLERFGLKCQKIKMTGFMNKENVIAFNVDMFKALLEKSV